MSIKNKQKKVISFLIEHGYSQSKIAELLDVTQPTVSKIIASMGESQQELTFTITNIINVRHPYNHTIPGENSTIEAKCNETGKEVTIKVTRSAVNDRYFVKKELLEAHKRIEESSTLAQNLQIGDIL